MPPKSSGIVELGHVETLRRGLRRARHWGRTPLVAGVQSCASAGLGRPSML